MSEMPFNVADLANFDMNATYNVADGGGIPDIQVVGQPDGSDTSIYDTPKPTTTTTTTTPSGGASSPSWWEAQQAQQRQSIADTITAMFSRYGLGSLAGTILSYAKQGMSGDAIAMAIRQTGEYKARFPAMDALAAKGRAISEAAYIEYESTAASLERQYGLPTGMLTNSVTNLLTNEVSAAEMSDRVQLASAGSILAPDDFKAEMKRQFGVDQGGLTAYYLDPTIAQPLLEKQYAMGLIGTEAQRQGIRDLQVETISALQAQGITQSQAKQGFGQVAASEGLTQGKGDTVTQSELVGATFGTDPGAAASVERAAKAKRASFDGGGGFATDKGGITGLGVSST